VKNNKEGGTIKLSARNLKRVARMPIKDRGEILKILKIQAKRRKGRHSSQTTRLQTSFKPITSNSSSNTTSSSANNDWEHWVTLHGNSTKVAEDAVEIGRAIGVKYTGDPTNRFNVLSKEGRRQLR